MTKLPVKFWTQSALKKAATARYGANWQSALAGDLKINPRTVRRWASGETAVPLYVKLFFAPKKAK